MTDPDACRGCRGWSYAGPAAWNRGRAGPGLSFRQADGIEGAVGEFTARSPGLL